MVNMSFLSLKFIKTIPGQSILVRYRVLNLKPIVYLQVTTTRKKRQVDMYNYWKMAKRVRHAYSLGNIEYTDKTGIYRKLYLQKHGSFMVTWVFTNGTVHVHRDQVNQIINVRRLEPHFVWNIRWRPQGTLSNMCGFWGSIP